jgi:RNA polymerase sigma-B factor
MMTTATTATTAQSPTASGNWDASQPERWAVRRTETRELIARTQTADKQSRKRLREQVVLIHLDLADTIARRYSGHGPEADDIRQVAYVGLIKASQRFDPDKGDDFVSFAVPTISGEIKRHLRDHGWVIRPPRPVQELRSQLNALIGSLAQELGHSPTSAELACRLDRDLADVKEAMIAHESMHPASLDVSVAEDDTLTLADTIGRVDSALDRAEAVANLSPALRRLSTRERNIVYLRFFEELTQQEIATRLGVTQMQVSRLLKKILTTLHSALIDDDPSRSVVTIPEGRRSRQSDALSQPA